MALTKVGKEGITGISNSSDANAITIDSSENVMIGTTNTLPAINNVSGISLAAQYGGRLEVSRDDNEAVAINRKTSDGSLVSLKKDGSTVGLIGSKGGDLTLGTGAIGVRFEDSNNAIVPFDTGTLGSSDNDIDLGKSSVRWNDLYLGGNLYIGGTGSANALDDYEEGTWTPTFGGSSSNPSVTLDLQYGTYTKIGNVVIARFGIGTDAVSSTGSGSLLVNGLPFTANSLGDFESGPALAYSFGQTIVDMVMGIPANTTAVIIYSNNNGASTFTTSALTDGLNKNRLIGTVIYTV